MANQASLYIRNVENPLISILMPVKNAGKYLYECLDSIVQQTETSWELIAVDDFSQDDSWQLLNTFSTQDERIICLKNTKPGIIPALRSAFKLSKGSLITRMDADDRMALDKLALLSQACSANGSKSLATGFVSYFSDATLGLGYQKYAAWLNGLTQHGANYTEIYKECVIPSPCWMIHREDLVRCGSFDSSRYPEDYDLCFRFYEQQMKVYGVPQVLHHWRDHPQRASRNDPNYADNTFLDLKLFYFLKLDYKPSMPLVIWGAGAKGKRIALELKQKGLGFLWLCNNPRKIGQEIYGVNLMDDNGEHLPTGPCQVIVAVANPDDQAVILQRLEKYSNCKSYFFC